MLEHRKIQFSRFFLKLQESRISLGRNGQCITRPYAQGGSKHIAITVVAAGNVLAKSLKNALIENVEGETFSCL